MSTNTPIPEVQGQETTTPIEDLQTAVTDSTPVPVQGETTDTVPEGYFEHTVTQEDLDANPGEDLTLGEEILIPIAEDAEPIEVQEVEPEVKSLIEKYESTHWVKVYKSESGDYWEVFLGHKSSLPLHSTCNVLREAATANLNLGFHKFTSGTKEEVMTTITGW